MSPKIGDDMVPQSKWPGLLALPFDIRQTIWQYSCKEDCYHDSNSDDSKPPTPAPTSHKLTQACRMIREDTLDLHYQLHSFRLSICQFPDWLNLVGAHAAELRHVRLGIRCVCQGFDIYSGTYPWHDRQAHLMALLKFCVSNLNCDVSFYYPEKYTYRCIANGEKSCRARVRMNRAAGDRLYTSDDQDSPYLPYLVADRISVSRWLYNRAVNGDSRSINGWTRDREGELLFHPAVALIYDTIRDMRADYFAWRHLLGDGIVTNFNIPSFRSEDPRMEVYVDHNSAKLRGVDCALLIGKLKLNDQAKIVFINSDQGKEGPDTSRLSGPLFL